MLGEAEWEREAMEGGGQGLRAPGHAARGRHAGLSPEQSGAVGHKTQLVL